MELIGKKTNIAYPMQRYGQATGAYHIQFNETYTKNNPIYLAVDGEPYRLEKA
jgi:hypothetical protein